MGSLLSSLCVPPVSPVSPPAWQVPYYEYALDTILDSETLSEESLTEEQQELVENAAEALYGLIHARFIISQRGLAVMAEKYKNGDFGRCPRYYCQEQHCLPVGLSDQPHQATVKLYCPRCQGLYYPRYKHQGSVDGAYFGSTFAHFLLLTYPSLRIPRDATPYTPRVWGFKLHETALLPVPDSAKQGAKAEPASKKEGPPRNSR